MLVAIALIFAPTLFQGFVKLDDDFIFVGLYRHYSQWKHVFSSFTEHFWAPAHTPSSYYRPIISAYYVIISCLAKLFVGGPAPGLFHALNIVLHMTVSWLVFRLLTRLELPKQLAMFASLIFAIHPALSGTVAWLGGNNDLLLAIWVLLGFTAFLDYLGYSRSMKPRPKNSAIWFCIFYTFLALITKESAIAMAPAWLLLVWMLPSRKNFAPDLKIRTRKLVFCWSIVFGIWFLIRHLVLQNAQSFSSTDLIQSFLSVLGGVPLYLGKWILPLSLPVMPVLVDTGFVAGVLAISGIIFLLYRSSGEVRAWRLFGLFWFLGTLLPTFLHHHPASDFIFVLREDRLYVASIGLLIFSVQGIPLERWLKEFRKPVLLGASALLLVMIFLTSLHLQYFKNAETFYLGTTQTSPHLALGYLHLGDAYYLKHDIPSAESSYLKAMQLAPTEPQLHNNLGVLYMNTDRLEQAVTEFHEEVRTDPTYAISWFNLGLIAKNRGNLDEAETYFVKATEVNPGYIDAYMNLVNLYSIQHHDEKARQLLGTIQNLGVPVQGL